VVWYVALLVCQFYFSLKRTYLRL